MASKGDAPKNGSRQIEVSEKDADMLRFAGHVAGTNAGGVLRKLVMDARDRGRQSS